MINPRHFPAEALVRLQNGLGTREDVSTVRASLTWRAMHGTNISQWPYTGWAAQADIGEKLLNKLEKNNELP